MSQRFFTFILLSFFSALLYGQENPTTQELIKVQFDCRGCNNNFIRQNIRSVSHVRDQALADVYVLINQTFTPATRLFNISLQGLNEFEGINNQFEHTISRTQTSLEQNEELVEVLRISLAPYLLHRMSDALSLVIEQDSLHTSAPEDEIDKWRNWIFSVAGRLNLNQQDTRRQSSVTLRFDGDKVTENWRVRLDGRLRRNVLKITEDGEDFTSRVENEFIGGSVVKSLSNHWSAGVFSSYFANTADNLNSRVNSSLALEYNFFDYEDVLTREMTIAYRIGMNWQHYQDSTIFDRLEDTFGSQSLAVEIRFRRNWGNFFSTIRGSHFLDNPKRNRLSVDNSASVRIWKGLTVQLNVEFNIIRDQINLPKGEASLEDVILQQRAIAKSYDLFVGTGINYTFGSIFNNILNTRL